MPPPPDKEDKLATWPNWPLKMRTSSSQEEGTEREFSVMTQSFEGDEKGFIKKLHCIKVDDNYKPVLGSEFQLKADLVLLAMGFVSPVYDGMVKEFGVKFVIVDYLQLMRSGVKTQSRAQEIAEISRGLKAVAKELSIPVMALSQLSRAVESRGGDKKPQLSDLRES